MNKLEKDGKVAVLYSPGYGAGWSTWSDDAHAETLLFDADIAQAVLNGDRELAAQLATEKCPGVYLGGASDLEVEWLEKGAKFEVEEYDGSETIHVIGDRDYYVA